MIHGIHYIENFAQNPTTLFGHLLSTINWDERIKARKTASFGLPYNYSQIDYPFQEMLPELKILSNQIHTQIGFEPNNCLINLYENGESKMGFHSDQVDILEKETGVVIISLGSTRVLQFRKIKNKEEKTNYPLPSGSLLYMDQPIQSIWQHAIPKMNTNEARMSLTFRKIKQN